MGWAALANPDSRQNQKARMARARWLVIRLGREAVEAKLPELSEDDQELIKRLLDEIYPVTVH